MGKLASLARFTRVRTRLLVLMLIWIAAPVVGQEMFWMDGHGGRAQNELNRAAESLHPGIGIRKVQMECPQSAASTCLGIFTIAGSLLVPLGVRANQFSDPDDDVSVLKVVAHAICSGDSQNVVLDARAAYASPILADKLKQIGLDERLSRLLLDQNRDALIPPSGAYECLRVTPRKTVEDAFGAPTGDATKEEARRRSFQKAFPATKGYAALSLPAFSAPKDLAAVYVLYSCGTACGKGRVYLLARAHGGWKLAKELPLWDF